MSDSPSVLPAVLGWRQGHDTENLRLYALDRGPSPRWMGPAGRVAEEGIRETVGAYEGDRFLVVHLGSRHVPDEQVARVTAAILELLDAETGRAEE
jgi:hypothetical protein